MRSASRLASSHRSTKSSNCSRGSDGIVSLILFFDGQCLGGTRPHGLLDLRPILFGRFVIDDFDLAALGHLEVVGRLELAHRVALAEIQVDFDSKM